MTLEASAGRDSGLGSAVARSAWKAAGVAEPVLDSRWLWVAAVFTGVGPLIIGYAAGSWWHQPLGAGLLFMLLLAAVRRDRPVVGMGVLAAAFAAHNAVAITLAYRDPAGSALIMPDAAGYYQAQVEWITTGTDPEYDWANWVPHHLQLIVVISAFCVTSMGLLPLVEGFYQVDLMNFYVGNLLANSTQPVTALFLGWHPWSAIRGLCYMVLVYELASWTLERVTSRVLSTPSARRRRWAAALTLFAADGVVKLLALDFVRNGLAANFIGTP